MSWCSNTNASENNHYFSQGFDAEDEFGMEEGENQETYVVKPDSPVNYQTYMNRTPRTRWSKQDTQLFYEVNKLDLADCLNDKILLVHNHCRSFFLFFVLVLGNSRVWEQSIDGTTIIS